MIRSALQQTFLAFSLIILASSSGCDWHAASGNSTAVEKSGPEDRFKRIMDSFRRKIDGQPVGFVMTQGSSRTTMLGSNKVTSELVKPATADGHYKAVVTVTTVSHYSLRRSKAADDAEREKNAKHQGKNALDDPKEKKGVNILETDLAGPPNNDSAQSPTSPAPPDEDVVTRRPAQDERKYELVDNGQHWALVTRLDLKTEQSIQFAFDEALAQQ